ncbi:MAG: cytidylate kinase [Spirochaetes bacterium GWD1_61_31]|nr:MAG: cytidylate kinase [Spirochaetes bacterium GWB1_60_80]OHD29581.1 MAG: cytidylate kinase [Spirochaetes bacterium GWC1_61_12]OHD37486.1 MAG: cytidylate kinase [Spirochaetes bacterium GWD1_61_31]OHD42005.1 MAG: cytidylate kinase [Spirochaetes bacterium GWE1_60_18]OHD61728.1 MAG: cytidylate kinase [Spirochaetes bacterium GWF1_60_12]
MIVAIDGPAGTGKSTIARMLAEKLSFIYVNSGSFYRAVTLAAHQAKLDFNDVASIETLLPGLVLGFRNHALYLNGKNVEADLHSDLIDAHVAQLSAIPAVRNTVNNVLRAYAKGRNLVMEGRDITTVVFPDAELKIYIDASPEARATRRFNQGTSQLSLIEIQAGIEERDRIDKAKTIGALKIAPEAWYLDTSDLTIAAVYDKINAKIQQQGNRMTKEVEMGTVAPSDECIQTQLQEQYLKSMDHLEEGDLVEGRVVQITNDSVFVDVGAKSEGKIPLTEFQTPPAVGDNVTVVLLKKENRSGESVVSKQKADEKVHWRNIQNAHKNHETVEGIIEKEIKGGFEVSLGFGLRAFLPVSKADIQRVEKGDYLIKQKSNFYLERLYSERRVNIVVNRREWLEEDTKKRREKFFTTVQLGDTVDGIVKSFTSFGAFIDLGGFDGLLHINDMSWGHVTKPKDFVRKGQEIKLKVIKIDPEEGRINLSLKHFSQDPWDTFESRYQLDAIVKGTVTKLTDYGAFIELEDGIEGLAHISEFSWVKRVKKPDEMLKIGDIVECMILGYDLDQQKVSLGLRQVQDNPWETISERYPVGMRLTRKVVKLTASGAFVQLEEGIDGFLSAEELSWTKKVRNPSSELQVDQEVEVLVIENSPENHSIRLSVRRLADDPWQGFCTAYQVGSQIEGVVSSITDFGLFVKVQGDIEGLIHKANISDSKEEEFETAVKRFEIGTPVKAVIIELSADKQKLALSIKDLNRKQLQAEMSKFMDQGNTSEGFTLGDLLKHKKDDTRDNA